MSAVFTRLLDGSNKRQGPTQIASGSVPVSGTGIEMATKQVKPQEDEEHEETGDFSRFFGDIANRTSQAAGRASTFMLASGVVLVWAITGPLFQFSDTWQLVINTGTTIVTFLMVFLIQNSQNRDSAAIQVKLDELIRVSSAHNSFVGIEHLTDEELEDIRTKCERRAEAETDGEEFVKRTGDKAKKAGGPRRGGRISR